MRLKLALLMIVGIFLGAGVAIWMQLPSGAGRQMASFGKASVGGPFTLTDHTGKRVTDRDFRGKYMLVYFGFTYCPDVCPGSLQVVGAALDQLGPKADRITPILVSVDPERDTPEQMALYVKNFHPRLVGLTGSPEEIAAVARVYRVYYQKTKDPKSSAPYTIDHVSMLFLMDPEGEFVTFFRHGTSAAEMAAKLAQLP
jgi:protein SCO1/2